MVVVALIVDFFAMNRQGAHRVSTREALNWTLIWVALAMVFLGWLWFQLGGMSNDPAIRETANTRSLEFLTGYLIEKALAIDNIFVFLMIFTYFGVPPQFQKRVIMYGILMALVLRAAMILVGAWLIAHFHWILYVFGAFLLYTGWSMWRAAGEEPDLERNPLINWVRSRIPMATGYSGEQFFVRDSGKLIATPLFVVIILIGIVDVIFAVDSIPAIFAITTDPFIVLTSNVFAILGLRAMYFLLANMQEKFHLLSYGLALVLAFIGVKLLLIDIWKIPIVVSLLFTTTVLAASMVLSLRYPAAEGASTSSYPFRKRRSDDSDKDPEANPGSP